MQNNTLFFLFAVFLVSLCHTFELDHPENLMWRAPEGVRVKRQWGGGYPGMYGGGGYPGMYGGGGYPGGGYGGGMPMGGSYGSSSWGSYSSSKSGGFSSFNTGFYGR
ncbi:Protein CBG02415 [Caenorhabditis briggsae]|uniref:Uncharacterized protein n=2 Tax=Caenorhabditis briggsae TaxID=6238 RepID=A0AAE9E9X9_CAEBR|nr:Protein CBG02415 [Caenorhabditis briggsae]ULU06932.1 hypothetical protein L3Y34_018609 [Caenorhabditis briggsae]UMM18855.1 hypothetical protein L5515_014729 [Caenorhabditis briggsae]CAP24095.1 Protein CBG02415 [Caenorhabditis briggsae]